MADIDQISIFDGEPTKWQLHTLAKKCFSSLRKMHFWKVGISLFGRVVIIDDNIWYTQKGNWSSSNFLKCLFWSKEK